MWYNDSAANYIGYGKNLVQLLSGYTGFLCFAQVVFYTIITAQNHACYQAQQFFCFYIKCACCISVGIEVPKPFYNQVVPG